MKKGKALKIMKKYDMIDPNMSLKYFSMMKNIMCPHSSWREWCQYILFLNWINGKAPDQGTWIEELHTQFGGSITIYVR